MQTVKCLLCAAMFLLTAAGPASARDFYGASVTDRDVPSSFMSFGIYGDHPVVGSVAPGSPAEDAGFVRGDIVMSLNRKPITRSADLARCGDDTLRVGIFDGLKWQTLTVDRIAIEKHKARLLAARRNAAADAGAAGASASLPDDGQPDSEPALRFDDASLSDVTVNVVSESSVNVVDDSSGSSKQTPTSMRKQIPLDDSSHDLEDIDW